jgi:hypothetical protein
LNICRARRTSSADVRVLNMAAMLPPAPVQIFGMLTPDILPSARIISP